MNKLIFVCSPFRWDVERNIQYARELCLQVLRDWDVPFAPHLLFPQFLDDTIEYERNMGISAWLIFMQKCDDILVGDKYWISEWMKKEIDFFENDWDLESIVEKARARRIELWQKDEWPKNRLKAFKKLKY